MIVRLVGLICLSVLKQNSFTMRSYSRPYVMNQITTFSESLQRAIGAGDQHDKEFHDCCESYNLSSSSSNGSCLANTF